MNQNREKNSWIEYGAVLWALIFATLHVAWALGWYVGLDAESASKAFERGWFLAYDLIAAGLCAAAVAVALALVQSWGRQLPRSLVSVLAWGAAGVLTLRGAAGCRRGYLPFCYRQRHLICFLALGCVVLLGRWFIRVERLAISPRFHSIPTISGVLRERRNFIFNESG